MSERIVDVTLHETTRERYLNYALSVITARALPDVRDGLKPVQRRILYSMYESLKLTPDAKPRKSAAVVGDVMAKYHPHGDQSIYDALVRMAQDFALRYPLVDGQGNFGSLDGDSAAAMRYTECRLRHLAQELLTELKKDTVPFRLNYDGTLEEPVVLPAQVPNLLINGTSGIAVGMATNIPPHNLGEVVDALIALIDAPELGLEDIVGTYILGPDFPTGGAILTGRQDLLEVYGTGRGPIEMRGEYERVGRGRIVIRSVPYGVNKADLIADIADHIRSGRLPLLVDVRDESTDSVRIVLELKRGADADAVMAYLYKRTALQSRFSVNMTALCPTDDPEVCQPAQLDLVEVLEAFLEFRYQVVHRRLEHDLAQLERRIHVLRAFETVFAALDEAIALIRKSDGRAEAKTALRHRFDLDEEQADAILTLRLYRLARLEIEAIRSELEEKRAQADELRVTLGSEDRMWALIRAELVDLREAYGDARRTHVLGPVEPVEFSEEVYIVEEDAFVMVTREGRFKRQKSYTELAAVRVPDGDEVGWVVPCSSRETIVLFTNKGRAYTLRSAEIPMTTGYGDVIQTRFDFADGECVVGVATSDPRSLPDPIPSQLQALEDGDPQPPYALAISRRGKGVRFSLEGYVDPSTVAGRLFMRLDTADDADEVVNVLMTDGSEVVSLASRSGRFLLFPVDEVNVLAGPGKGVMAIKLEESDQVLDFTLTTERMDGLKVRTNRGRVEVLRPNKYQVTHRGNRGRELIRVGYLAEAYKRPVEIVWSKDDGDETDEDADGSRDAEEDDDPESHGVRRLADPPDGTASQGDLFDE